MKTDDARVFKTTSNAAMYRMELQKIELTIRRKIWGKKTYKMQLKWTKKKTIKDEMNYMEVRCSQEDWGY